MAETQKLVSSPYLNGQTTQEQAKTAVKKQSTQARQAKTAGQTARKPSTAKPAESLTGQVATAAETAILVPVGATLEARDAVVEAIQPWTSRSGAEKEIDRVRKDVRRFERRGNKAVRGLRTRYNRALREVRKRRTKTTRTIKRNRTQAERVVKQNRRRVETEIRSRRRRVEKTVRPQVTRVTKQAKERVSALV